MKTIGCPIRIISTPSYWPQETHRIIAESANLANGFPTFDPNVHRKGEKRHTAYNFTMAQGTTPWVMLVMQVDKLNTVFRFVEIGQSFHQFTNAKEYLLEHGEASLKKNRERYNKLVKKCLPPLIKKIRWRNQDQGRCPRWGGVIGA